MKRVHVCTAAMCPRFLVASGSLGQAFTAFFYFAHWFLCDIFLPQLKR